MRLRIGIVSILLLILPIPKLCSCRGALVDYSHKHRISDMFSLLLRNFDMESLMLHTTILSKYLELIPRMMIVVLDNQPIDRAAETVRFFDDSHKSGSRRADHGDSSPIKTPEAFREAYVSEYLIEGFSKSLPEAMASMQDVESPAGKVVRLIMDRLQENPIIRDTSRFFETELQKLVEEFLQSMAGDTVKAFQEIRSTVLSMVSLDNEAAEIFRSKNIGLMVEKMLNNLGQTASRSDSKVLPSIEDMMSVLGPFMAYCINWAVTPLMKAIVPNLRMLLKKFHEFLTTTVEVPILSGLLMNSAKDVLENFKNGNKLVPKYDNHQHGMTVLHWMALIATTCTMYLLDNGYIQNYSKDIIRKYKSHPVSLKDKVWLNEGEARKIIKVVLDLERDIETGFGGIERPYVPLDVYKGLDSRAQRKLSYYFGSVSSMCSTLQAHLHELGRCSTSLQVVAMLVNFPLQLIKSMFDFPVYGNYMEVGDNTSLDSIDKSSLRRNSKVTFGEKDDHIRAMKYEVYHLRLLSWFFGFLEAIFALVPIRTTSEMYPEGLDYNLPPVSLNKFVIVMFGRLPSSILSIWATVQQFLTGIYEDLLFKESEYTALNGMFGSERRDRASANLSIHTRYGLFKADTIRYTLKCLSWSYRKLVLRDDDRYLPFKSEMSQKIRPVLDELTGGRSPTPTRRGLEFISAFSTTPLPYAAKDLYMEDLERESPGGQASLDVLLPLPILQHIKGQVAFAMALLMEELQIAELGAYTWLAHAIWGNLLSSIVHNEVFDTFSPVGLYHNYPARIEYEYKDDEAPDFFSYVPPKAKSESNALATASSLNPKITKTSPKDETHSIIPPPVWGQQNAGFDKRQNVTLPRDNMPANVTLSKSVPKPVEPASEPKTAEKPAKTGTDEGESVEVLLKGLASIKPIDALGY